MLRAFVNAFKIPDLRKKILFTLFIIAVFRSVRTSPPRTSTSPSSQRSSQTPNGGQSVLQFIDLFSGGALTRFAVFSLGIMPYITSSIIMQLLTVVIPRLEQWQEQGEIGIKKITQWTRYMTVTLALLQSTGLVFLFHRPQFQTSCGTFDAPHVALIVLTLTAGHGHDHVAGRADHAARHRQRHVDPDLHQRDLARCRPRAWPSCSRRAGAVLLLPAARRRRSSSPSCSWSRGSGASRSSTPSASWAGG